MALRKEGYRPVYKQIQIEEKKTLNINETLESLTPVVEQQRPTPPPVPPTPQVEKEKPVQVKPAKGAKPTKERVELPNAFFCTLDGNYRLLTTPSLGITLGQEIKRSGWYLTAATGFSYKPMSAALSCDGNGLIDGLMPAYSGNIQHSRLSVVAGALLRVHSTTAVYAGLGYGYNSLAWQLKDGDWARHTAHTIQGADIQLGMHFNIKGLVLRAGVTTTNFKTMEVNVGLGVGLQKR